MLQFICNSDDAEFAFAIKPEFKAKFPATPQPIANFLKFLEDQGVLNVTLVNHSKIEREPASDAKRVSYKMANTVDTRWKPNPAKDSDNTYWVLKLDLAKVRECPHLRIVTKLECTAYKNIPSHIPFSFQACLCVFVSWGPYGVCMQVLC